MPLAWVIIAAVFILTLGLYGLKNLIPDAIGTGYIFLYSGMTMLSILIWQREIIAPQYVLWIGIVLLLCLMPLLPLTSNDAQRYLWDGAVFLSGLDPYVTAPDSSDATKLRMFWPTPEEHSAYPTLYPPGALCLFALSALAGPIYGLWVWKCLVTLAAIASLCLSFDLLRRRNALKALPLMAFSPLLIFETGAGYHLDIFSCLAICATLWSLDRERMIWAGLIIGIAASIKFLPALIAGPLIFYLKPHKALKLFLAASLTWASIYLLMFGFGYKPLGLLPTFFEKWRGGAPLYPLLESLKVTLSLNNIGFLMMLSALAVTGFGLSALLARKGHIIIAISFTLAVPLLLSPVLFPWYLMVFVPLLALRPNMTLILTLALSPLFYIVLNRWLSQGIWEPATWASVLMFTGIIIGLAYDIARNLYGTDGRT